MKIPLSQIDLPDRDIRGDIDWDWIDELARSLQDHGQKQAISVFQKPDNRYEVIFGACRTRAAQLNDWDEIEATVDTEPDPSKRHGSKLIENIQRRDMTPVEEAFALVDFMDDETADIRSLQRKTGKSREWVVSRVAILNMPVDMQKAMQAGQIGLAVARHLAGIENEEMRNYYVKHAIESGCTADVAKNWAITASYAASGIAPIDPNGKIGEELLEELQYVVQTFSCFCCTRPSTFRDSMQVVLCNQCVDGIANTRTKGERLVHLPPVVQS